VKCHVCGKGPQECVTVFRQNEKGGPGSWACEEHATIAPDPTTKAVTDALTQKPGATTEVYGDGRVLHFPGANPGTQYTLCGLDTGLMKHEHRPIEWAGIWCSACMRSAIGKENE
jgi:hypothetical protein